MSTKQLLINEIESLPENIIDEVYKYVRYLKMKKNQNCIADITLASQKSLAKDWNTSEEDLAWENL